MSKNRKETCVFCGKNEYGVETIDQIPHEQICPQSFILNELLSYCGEKIKPHDFICTSHELNLKFKYISYKNDLPFSKQFKREKSTVYECSSCKVYCYKDQRMVIDISQLSDPFKQFILYEYSPDKSIITRSGRGIGEGDYLCRNCYKTFRKTRYSKFKGETSSHIDTRGRPKSVKKVGEERLTADKCVICDNTYEKKQGREYVHYSLTNSVKAVMKLANANKVLPIDFSGNILHNKCSKKLTGLVNKHKVCSICKKGINKEKSILVDGENKIKLDSFLKKIMLSLIPYILKKYIKDVKK